MTDQSGNTSTCSFTVTVNDTEAPVLACHDITVGNNLGTCEATVDYCDDSFVYAISGADGDIGYLYKLNPNTGALIATVGSTGYAYTTGLAINPTNGLLYASAIDYNTYRGVLILLNPTTGAGTFVAIPAQLSDITFSPTGVLYGWVGYNIDNNLSNYLCTIDLSTGAVTQIGPTDNGCWDGLSFDATGKLYTNNTCYNELQQLNPVTGNIISYVPISGGYPTDVLGFRPSTNKAYTVLYNYPQFQYTSINTNTGALSILGDSPAYIAGLAFNQCAVTANDNCNIATISYDPEEGMIHPVGSTTPVTVTVTDIHGLTSTCSFNVTVADTENQQ